MISGLPTYQYTSSNHIQLEIDLINDQLSLRKSKRESENIDLRILVATADINMDEYIGTIIISGFKKVLIEYASDGIEVLNHISRSIPKVAIIDEVLLEVLTSEKGKACPHLLNTPLLLLSESTLSTSNQTWLSTFEQSGILSKPFDSKTLVDAINNFYIDPKGE